MLAPLLFILFGVYWLGIEMGWIPLITTNILWPIILILIGTIMLVKHAKPKKR